MKNAHETISQNLATLISAELEHMNNTENLTTLQEELLEGFDTFIFNDFPLASENHLTNNFLFDPLRGNFSKRLTSVLPKSSKKLQIRKDPTTLITKEKDLGLLETNYNKECFGNSMIKNEKDIEIQCSKMKEHFTEDNKPDNINPEIILDLLQLTPLKNDVDVTIRNNSLMKWWEELHKVNNA